MILGSIFQEKYILYLEKIQLVPFHPSRSYVLYFKITVIGIVT